MSFYITNTEIERVNKIHSNLHFDHRGYFIEIFSEEIFFEKLGVNFVQDNLSFSCKNVLRGLHCQLKYPQGKLIKVISGWILDVLVDLRPTSNTFGNWLSFDLQSTTDMLYIPPGLAHGFLTKSEEATVFYKTTDYYHPEFERTLLWDDPLLNIDWKLGSEIPIISEKDKNGKTFNECVREIIEIT